ncbi:MAG TPA: heat-inducible transcriptional repressor HrcA [Terriglobales bacterium]|nr:heat-inducible transcriptional repressor HrcA [Terriglobales bacterium]
MPITPQIGHRERQILTAIVETYISTGEPVGSRTLSRGSQEGLSAATIRNVMADLADAGFLDQPHTSAGRVPTAEAYRYYVEQFTGKAHLSHTDDSKLAENFRGVSDVQEFMERTSHVLSLVSSGVGVAVSSGGSKHALEHVYFTRLGAQKILAVLVTTAGIVRDRVLRMENDVSQQDLETVSRYLNENFRGWTMEAMQQEIAMRIERERSEYDRLMQSLEQLYKGGALAHAPDEKMVYVEGVANLVVSQEDKDRLGQLLRALEERQKVADILSAYLDTRQEAVRVVIGLEDTFPQMKDLVLIGAPARVNGEVRGSLAVIGPTRMNYENTINAVSYIAKLFDKILNETDQ